MTSTQMFKAKLIIMAFCLCVVAGSHVYFKGVDDGIAAIDEQAFQAYTDLAKPVHEVHHKHAKAVDSTVWAAAGIK